LSRRRKSWTGPARPKKLEKALPKETIGPTTPPMALSKRSRQALISGSPALLMRAAPIRRGMTENPLENGNCNSTWRPWIIKSAGEPPIGIAAQIKNPPPVGRWALFSYRSGWVSSPRLNPAISSLLCPCRHSARVADLNRSRDESGVRSRFQSSNLRHQAFRSEASIATCQWRVSATCSLVVHRSHRPLQRPRRPAR